MAARHSKDARPKQPTTKSTPTLTPDSQRAKDLLDEHFEELNKALSKEQSKPAEQFYKCMAKTAERSYPDIGKQANAFPAFFLSKHEVKRYPVGEKRSQPSTSSEDAGEQKSYPVECSTENIRKKESPIAVQEPEKESSLASSAEETGEKSIAATTVKYTGKKSSATATTGKKESIPTTSSKASTGRRIQQAASSEACGNSRKTQGPDLEQSCEEFVVSRRPESGLRGDSAHRLVGRVFRILNSSLERDGEPTMFIISGFEYNNLLYWIRKPVKVASLYNLSTKYPEVFQNADSCIDLKKLDGLCKYRGEIDLMVLHPQKGILLIQVKAIKRQVQIRTPDDKTVVGTQPVPDDKVVDRLKEAAQQLKKDADILDMVMERSKHWGQGQGCKVMRVIAVPNLSQDDLDKVKERANFEEGIKFLTQEAMTEEDTEAESETNIDVLREFWKKLPDIDTAEDRMVMIMKEIVGLYVGPLSSVIKSKERDLSVAMGTFPQCVNMTALLFKRLILSPTQTEIVKGKTKGQTHVYISGPPGSGKTVLLMLKAVDFLKEDPNNQVIVVNMYIGAEGRAIGQCIKDTVLRNLTTVEENSSTPADTTRLHLLSIDLDHNKFVQRVKNLLFPSKTAGKPAGLSSTTNSPKADGGALPECPKTDEDMKAKMKHVLFIVDEVHREAFWSEILEAFRGELLDSQVWCAGLFSTNPEDFVEHSLDHVLRCPPAVQNVLYHVDWKQERKDKYKRDTKLEVSSNGPVPLCVRHESHVHSSQPDSVHVLNCALCAQQLADLLKRPNIVNITATKPQRAGKYAVSKQRDASKNPPPEQQVAILVNMPRSEYQQKDEHITTTVEAYMTHMKRVKEGTFISTLEKCGLRVDFRDQLASKDLKTCEGFHVLVTWIYNFQGLETDVVIVLPGDPSPPLLPPPPPPPPPSPSLPPSAARAPEREIPALGLEAASSGRVERHVEASSVGAGSSKFGRVERHVEASSVGAGSSKLGRVERHVEASSVGAGSSKLGRVERHVEASSVGAGSSKLGRSDSGPSPGGADSREVRPGALRDRAEERAQSLGHSPTSLEWRKQDLERYSPWDKTNVLVAGSRTLSLLILLVP